MPQPILNKGDFMKNRIYHIPIFVPHCGCPHDCVFCNQRHITGHVGEVRSKDVAEIADSYLKTMNTDGDCRIEIAFFGGSFTGIDFERQTELLQTAYEYLKDGRVQGIRCSTRPDCIDSKILDNLKRYGVTCIELGVQSADSDVLRLSRRGHSFWEVVKASALIKEYGISLGLQMMMGLPGDTFEKTVSTAEKIIALNPDCVRIYPTLVVEDTHLYDMYKSGEYKPLTVEDAAEQLSVIIPMFVRENIDILRVGLQTTDEINSSTVYGPYHPALKELALGRIFQKAILSEIKEPFPPVIEVLCNPSEISAVSGHKKCNKKKIKEITGAELRVIGDAGLRCGEIKICGKIVDIYAGMC